MEEKKQQEGISVKELEGFVKKYRFEVFIVALFILAGIFGMGLIWRATWSVGLAAIGGIIGGIIPRKVLKMAHAIMGFFFRQDKNTQLIIAGVILVLAILLSPLIFFIAGLHAGKSLHLTMAEVSSTHEKR
jgi:hypothetical protein